MRTVRSKAELREALLEPRRQGKRIGLVPTMGYFHEGHLSLMCRAGQDCDVVVVSLFVNPTQFGPNEDLEAYPRDEGRDAQLAAAEGVDLLWTPDVAEMYPEVSTRPWRWATHSPAFSRAIRNTAGAPTSAG